MIYSYKSVHSGEAEAVGEVKDQQTVIRNRTGPSISLLIFLTAVLQ